MAHSLTLDIPESLYKRLSDLARSQGKEVAEVALEKLANGSEPTEEDPFEKFIGFFDSGGTDWADKHDEYLGKQLYEEMRGEKK